MLKKSLILGGMVIGSLVLSGCGSLSPQLQAKVDKLDLVKKGKTIKINKTYKITYPANKYVGNDIEDRNKLQKVVINKALRTAVKKTMGISFVFCLNLKSFATSKPSRPGIWISSKMRWTFSFKAISNASFPEFAWKSLTFSTFSNKAPRVKRLFLLSSTAKMLNI